MTYCVCLEMAAFQSFRCGAVVLSSTSNLIQHLMTAADTITGTLYLPLPLLPAPSIGTLTQKEHLLDRQNSYLKCLTEIFRHFSLKLPKLDIRVLLPAIPGVSPTPLSLPPEVIISAYPSVSQTEASPAFQILSARISAPCEYMFLSDVEPSVSLPFQESDSEHLGSHQHVAVGGTFDHLHQGHCLLLAATAICSSSSCLVGVSSGALLANKVLKELVEPLELRCTRVRELMQDMRPGLQLNIVAITDPYGPTISDCTLECMVVSEETSKGGAAINKKREEIGFQLMDTQLVSVLGGTNDKLSSTQRRKELLGGFNKQEPSEKNKKVCAPYVIGLTGGTCSGKTTISSHLASRGAYVINCDQLGHEAYKPGTATHRQLVETFGRSILDAEERINRKELASIVFSDPDKLVQLNHTVWPAIGSLLQLQLDVALQEGARVCVVDAAVLLEAEWECYVDELWVSFVPEQQAILRLMERNGVNEETARSRVSSQLSNEEKIARANVYFCSQWDQQVTLNQVDLAWDSLQQRIPCYSKSNSL